MLLISLMLFKFGCIWKVDMNRSRFIKGYAELTMYFCEHVGADVASDYVTVDGFELGKWLVEVRNQWRAGKLTQKQLSMLQRAGIAQSVKEQTWESLYFYAREYFNEHGNIDIPRSYRTVDGVMLGAWLERQKKRLELLTDEQSRKLAFIGIRKSDK